MILMTGGAGFIGSNLLWHMNEAGFHRIAVADRLRNDDKWQNLRGREFAEFLQPSQVGAWLSSAPRLDAIIHLGALSVSTDDADRVMAENFATSLQLWRYAAEHDVPFLYASAAATYGDDATGFVDDNALASLRRLRPLSLFGFSKHVFDLKVIRDSLDGEKTPPRWYGLKFFSVYGPNEYHKCGMRSPVYELATALMAGRPLQLFKSDRPDMADGAQARDFIHVDDVCRIILWLLTSNVSSGLYNVGSGRARTFRDVAEAVFAALGQRAEIDFIDMPAALKGRYQHVTEADMRRLREAGWHEVPTPLEAGVRDYIQSYLAGGQRYR
ncbi:ADP-glyceromanno-heptose 6-epimerase precursor [Arboricoccus pini]|uniref:ADP-glyceromanno-heptose 6-epimerase n=1 Tax=Arboricoccus pini TaxID=1963835 RepID=A0A212RZI9_9PROT|nr:ADP-glyceromanno-heptose 6-epimerase [Arboricoccus pini]SNB78321.1 ADP-glyceromanno-heptose 6-epimerase precursor [Arboricoccus pini]